jgi:hypothetical protein
MLNRRYVVIAALGVTVNCSDVIAGKKPDEQCAGLKARIATLRLKQRMGYTARQGRLNRAQLEELESRQRRLCR